MPSLILREFSLRSIFDSKVITSPEDVDIIDVFFTILEILYSILELTVCFLLRFLCGFELPVSAHAMLNLLQFGF